MRRVIGTITLAAFGLFCLSPPGSAQEYRTEIQFYHGDHLGSVNLVTDEEGRVVQRIEYKPFGEPYLIEGQNVSPHKFTGKRLDESTGLYYFGGRYYDPQLGRFIQPDPLVPNPGNPQDLNRFTYARNNPLKYTDPTGYRPFWKRALRQVVAFVASSLVSIFNPVAGALVYAGINAAYAGYDASRSGASAGQILQASTAAGFGSASTYQPARGTPPFVSPNGPGDPFRKPWDERRPPTLLEQVTQVGVRSVLPIFWDREPITPEQVPTTPNSFSQEVAGPATTQPATETPLLGPRPFRGYLPPPVH